LIISKQRCEVIESADHVREITEHMIQSTLHRGVSTHTQAYDEENWELQSILDCVHGDLLNQEDISTDEPRGKEAEEIEAEIMRKVTARYDEKEAELGQEQMREFEKVTLLRTVDSKWMDHIDQMDQLRQGIHLRAYGQNDPLREYQMEGFNMFEAM